MNYLKQTAGIVSLLLFGCGQHKPADNEQLRSNNEQYARKLIEAGFLEYADSSKKGDLSGQLLKSFDIYNEACFRIVSIDAEELAEFNFDFFLPDLNSVLAKRNLRITAEKLNNDEHSADALVNGDTIRLYTQKELAAEQFWDTAPRNFFRKVNQILQSENCKERFYLLYSDNDLSVLLLTDKQFEIIVDYYQDDASEQPYIP